MGAGQAGERCCVGLCEPCFFGAIACLGQERRITGCLTRYNLPTFPHLEVSPRTTTSLSLEPFLVLKQK
jgi:hypothetical protein